MMPTSLLATGAAVDYGRAQTFSSYAQDVIDAAALRIAGDRNSLGSAKELALSDLSAAATRLGASDVSLDVVLLNSTDVEVTASASVNAIFLKAVPGMPDAIDVSRAGVARLRDIKVVSSAPELAMLDPYAGDYNRIYVYCYNKDKKNEPDKGRSQFTAIADNGGTTYTFTMPKCELNETVSFQLHNVRNSRTSPSKWDDPTVEQYDYFTDTTVDSNSVQSYDLDGWSILETVICDDLKSCSTTISKGGLVPTGTNRTPQRSSRGCTPGRYIYMGWEDRPPGRGWTDRDYDDIRIAVSCPETKTFERNVRLIK